MPRKRMDLTGQIFGRLTVIDEDNEVNGYRYWCCQCSCGNTTVAAQDNLRRGHTTSCGCFAKEDVTARNIENTKHGLCEDPLYSIWKAMKQRCYNPNSNDFEYWGGKGIIVCEEWLNDPETFIKWGHTNGYEPGLTIDRIDGDKNYQPSNCRWATRFEQTQNRVKTYRRRF